MIASPRLVALASWQKLLVGLLYALAALNLYWSLHWKLGLDQSIYAWAGDVILDGGVPYQDVWEIKGPVVHYAFALAQAIFGHNEWGIRVLDVLVIATGSYVCFKLGERVHSAFVGHLAASILVFLSCKNGFWFSAQPDSWASILIASLILQSFACEDKRRWTYAAFQALLVLVLMMQKPAYGAFIAIPLALDLWPASGEGPQWRSPLRFGFWFTAFASAMLLLLVSSGALAALWEIQFDFVVNAHLGAPYPTPLTALSKFNSKINAFYPSWLLLPGLLFLATRPKRLSLTMFAWLAMGTAFIVLQNKYFVYHFLLLSPVLSIVLALSIAVPARAVVSRMSWKPVGLRIALAFALSVIFVAPIAWNINLVWWIGSSLQKDPNRWADVAYSNRLNFDYLQHKRVAEFLIPRLEETDQILVWGYDTLIYYLCDRKPPGRFGSNYPIIGEIHQARKSRYRSEFMTGLVRASPKFFVVALGDKNSLMTQASVGYLPKFQRLDAYLRDHYSLNTRIGTFDIYERVEAQFGRAPSESANPLAAPTP